MSFYWDGTSAPCTFNNNNDGEEVADVCGVRHLSSSSFMHDDGVGTAVVHRNLLQWFNPTLSRVYCGIYARTYNTTGTGIYSSLARERVGLTFVTRDGGTVNNTLFLSHDGSVGIGGTVPGGNKLRITGDLQISGSIVNASIDCSLLTSGVLADARLPALDTAKVTSGVFAAARIPVIPHTKVTSGAFSTSRIPAIAATKVTSGVFANARIPSIAPTKFTAGTFPTSAISSLSASKITSGAFPRLINQRTLKPSEIAASSWTVGFGSWSHNNASPWADVIHLNTAADGNTNALLFNKSEIGMRVYQGTQGSATTYSTFKEACLKDAANGSFKISCTSTAVNAFEVELPDPAVSSGWRFFRYRGASFWGDGISTYNAANVYTSGTLHGTVENIMFRSPHVVAKNGAEASVRFGRSGGVATGRWWQMACLTNGTFHFGPEATTRLLISIACDVTASGEITIASDARLKTDVKTIDGALAKVAALRGVTYTKNGRRGVGVVAQEVREIMPEVVVEDESTEERWLSVAYESLVAPLIEALKEEQREVERLKRRLMKWRSRRRL